jgi:hypothetical protein
LRPLLVTSLIPTVFVSQAAASLRKQNIVVAMPYKFVRSAADRVSGAPPLRVADEPAWDITEPCILSHRKSYVATAQTSENSS